MPRIHTRVKRKLNMTTTRKGRFLNVKGKKGAKTFSREDLAHEHAKKLGLENYSVVPAKRNKRFKLSY